jgi:hypothetical protein
MLKRFCGLGIFLLCLLAAQGASACEICKPTGFVCGANGCELVEVCATPNFPKGGSESCYFISNVCVTSGETCLWVSLPETTTQEETCLEKVS